MAQERTTGGEFMVDVCVEYDATAAVYSDNIEDTLNYADMYEIINREMLTPSNLLEHLAGRIGEGLMDVFPQVKEVKVCVTKKNPPIGAQLEGAAVTLHLINDKTP
jgi:dihydroneopterin aldolase